MTANPDAAMRFHSLHRASTILLLANIWDAGGARLVENLGAPAIATTSAGVAWSHGYRDGNALPRDLLLQTVKSIARVTRAPLTVDIEAGYSDDAGEVETLITQLIDAGAAGINIEDGADPRELLCAKIAAAKRAASRSGVNLFVNARIDVYLKKLATPETRAAETASRAQQYRDAGADGVFAPGAVLPDEIREIAAATNLPLNLLAFPGLPPAAELFALGVKRLSAGSAIAETQWRNVATLASAFLGDGRSEPLSAASTPYGELNALFPALSG